LSSVVIFNQFNYYTVVFKQFNQITLGSITPSMSHAQTIWLADFNIVFFEYEI